MHVSLVSIEDRNIAQDGTKSGIHFIQKFMVTEISKYGKRNEAGLSHPKNKRQKETERKRDHFKNLFGISQANVSIQKEDSERDENLKKLVKKNL